MVQRIFMAAFVLLGIFIGLGQAQTADEIVNKYVAATGGLEKWKSLESFAVVSRSEAWSYDLYWKKPNLIRIEVAIKYPGPGLDIRSFDGTTGWRSSPLEGSEAARLMSGSEIRDLQETGDAFRELIDYKTKGHRLELVGKEPLDGNPAYQLKLTKPSGDVVQIFLDAKTFLEVKRVRHGRTPDGQEHDVVIAIGDYRAVGGLLLPHRIGNAVLEYQVNIPMDIAGFKMPGKSDEGQSQVHDPEKKDSDLTERVRTPERRAELLKANPEADVNKDGTLSLEEAWAFLKKDKAARQLLPVGTLAPDWTLKDPGAKLHRLSDYRGKVVVLDFWAVWCIPCHRAMPALQKLHNDLARRGLVVVGISTDEHGGDPVQLMKDRGYTYELLLNGETISEAYGVAGMPTIYVIGVDGRIIHSGFGANEIAEQRRRTFIEGYLTEQGK
jgi:peroxiredoxin/outer membrane lipoprotein-sorting protein